MINPLKIWESSQVTRLLIDFYESNFQKAGIPKGQGEKIILTTFESKLKVSEIELKTKINKLFLESKTHLNRLTSESDQLTLVDFKNVKTFLDIGANRLDTINKVGRFFPGVEKLIGIDLIPLNGIPKYPEKTEYYQVNPKDQEFPVDPESVDIVCFQYALHHFKSDEVIKNTLRKCKRVLAEQGQIIIWEESFVKSVNLKKLVEENNNLGFFTDYELTKRFYELDKDKKFEFIIANDWLINVNNHHMQWTGLYKNWEDWVELFQSCGFKLKRSVNLGLRISGHVKNGVHIMGEFIC